MFPNLPVCNDGLMYWLFIEIVDAVELYLRTWVQFLVSVTQWSTGYYIQIPLTIPYSSRKKHGGELFSHGMYVYFETTRF